jgi:hypothetical protein
MLEERQKSPWRFHAAIWARCRGWTLWKSLITLAEHLNTNPVR